MVFFNSLKKLYIIKSIMIRTTITKIYLFFKDKKFSIELHSKHLYSSFESKRRYAQSEMQSKILLAQELKHKYNPKYWTIDFTNTKEN